MLFKSLYHSPKNWQIQNTVISYAPLQRCLNSFECWIAVIRLRLEDYFEQRQIWGSLKIGLKCEEQGTPGSFNIHIEPWVYPHVVCINWPWPSICLWFMVHLYILHTAQLLLCLCFHVYIYSDDTGVCEKNLVCNTDFFRKNLKSKIVLYFEKKYVFSKMMIDNFFKIHIKTFL